MATMADSQARRTRRSFTDAYKTGAVRLVLDEGKTVAAAARDLGLTESSLRNWVEQARADDQGQDRANDRGAHRASRLAQRQSRVAHGARHPKKSRGLFRQEPGVVFAWIDAEKAEFPITKLCQYLQVSPSGFYAACGRPESARTQTDRRLRVLVRASFDESHQRVWQPAYSRGSHRAGGACQSEARHPRSRARR